MTDTEIIELIVGLQRRLKSGPRPRLLTEYLGPRVSYDPAYYGIELVLSQQEIELIIACLTEVLEEPKEVDFRYKEKFGNDYDLKMGAIACD